VAAISATIFEAETIDGEVVKDYGMLLRARSPYNRGRTVVVLAGASTFGTAAAARYFVEQCAFTRGDFAAVVTADVRNTHVLVPTLVTMMSLTTHIPAS
jgi:alkanesulfonate monooxygenase SsuD/methylene tetrahydromethanopterin reductase-like flavin-dependent oxidoreductase (luciferase family)